MAMVFIYFCLALILSANFANAIGVNWGQTCSNNLRPSIAAQLLKDNGIDKVKLFSADKSMVKAFANTGISVVVGIPNKDLEKYSNSFDDAKTWVEKNVTEHVKNNGVNITYVAVGNEPFLKSNNGIYLETIIPAITNIQKALDETGLGDQIKATTPINEEAYDLTQKAPSECDFRPDIKDTLVELVRLFDKNNAPFMLNINPIRSYQELEFSYDSVFFNPQAKAIVTDNSSNYDNFFDLSIDKLVSSLTLAGVPNLKIVVGEIGWPVDGGINANKTLAQKFYSGFLKKLYSEKGTPLRPGPIEVFLSSLLDEDMRSIAQGTHERHMGIFRFDGEPKFPIDLLGQGNETMPVAAKGVIHEFAIYCIFNNFTQTNWSHIPANLDYVCKAADCTALTYGSSCSHLDRFGNISYAFNMFFQMYGHQENSCNFEGLGTLTLMNPSTPECYFPIRMLVVPDGGMRVGFGASEIVVGILAMALLALLY